MDQPAGGPLEKSWWPVRIVLTAGFWLFRLVDRVAPRLTDLLGLGIETAHRCQQKIRAARQELGNQWDEDEDYPLIGRLDAHLRAAGLGTLHWLQTGPYHWAVMGRKDA